MKYPQTFTYHKEKAKLSYPFYLHLTLTSLKDKVIAKRITAPPYESEFYLLLLDFTRHKIYVLYLNVFIGVYIHNIWPLCACRAVTAILGVRISYPVNLYEVNNYSRCSSQLHCQPVLLSNYSCICLGVCIDVVWVAVWGGFVSTCRCVFVF